MTALTDAEMRAIAEAATPGGWKTHGAILGHKGDVFRPTAKQVKDCHHIARCFAEKPARPVLSDLEAIGASREAIAQIEANARHIATFDPPTVIALLDRLAKAEARVRELERALREIAEDAPTVDPGPAFEEGYGWVSSGNTDDVAYDAKQEVRWQHAQIARAALATPVGEA